MDNKISFFAGFTFTTMSTMATMDLAKTAVLGLVGGFFGIVGKELFYILRRKTRSWIDDRLKSK